MTSEDSLQNVQKIDILDQKYVLQPWENYRGLSYGDLVARWHSWLMCDNPDNYNSDDMLFMRGNIGYHNKRDTFYFKTNVVIPQGTAILIPVVTTLINYGDYHEGKQINDEFSLRQAVHDHVNAAGPFWATLEEIDGSNKFLKKIVPDLELFRVESPIFQLNISRQNPFLHRMDEPVLPGTYTALGSGYFVLLHDLIPSKYRIRFGGKGMYDFYTDAMYEITISDIEKIKKDISGQNTSPSELQENKIAIKANT